MDAVLTAAEAILRRHPAPALRMAELVARLRSEGPERRISEERLRALLDRHPTRFRILEVWTGPWRAVRGPSAGAALGRESWVAALAPDPDPPAEGVVSTRMRDTVRWLAHRVDPRSPHEISRWHRLALREEASRRELGRPAA